MLDAIRETFNSCYQGTNENNTCDNITEKVKGYAVLLFKAVIGVGLFVVNAPIFIGGFFLGIALYEHVDPTIDRIIKIWEKQTFFMSALTVFCGCLAGPLLTLAVSTFIYSAYVGSSLTIDALREGEEQLDPTIINAAGETH